MGFRRVAMCQVSVCQDFETQAEMSLSTCKCHTLTMKLSETSKPDILLRKWLSLSLLSWGQWIQRQELVLTKNASFFIHPSFCKITIFLIWLVQPNLRMETKFENNPARLDTTSQLPISWSPLQRTLFSDNPRLLTHPKVKFLTPLFRGHLTVLACHS